MIKSRPVSGLLFCFPGLRKAVLDPILQAGPGQAIFIRSGLRLMRWIATTDLMITDKPASPPGLPRVSKNAIARNTSKAAMVLDKREILDTS